MRSLLPVLIFGLLAASLVLAVYSLEQTPGPVNTPLPSKLSVNGRTFPITYTASTEPERERGLMNTRITNSTIMLFAWPSPGLYSFWMKDTNSSLDMIWVNASAGEGTVVYLVNGAPPCTSGIACPVYSPSSPANYVLETPGGFAQANGIGVGSTLNFT